MSTAETIKALESLSKKINPTIIYNEGWMIRLLVIESMIQKLNIKGIDFGLLENKNWSSEALISSPFVKTKNNREGYTHADIILGDFEVNFEERGEIKLNKNPQILGIIEAKMKSNLSQKTTNAEKYNQASRSVCCLSYMTKDNPECKIFYIVAAPDLRIKNIENQIKKRFEQIKARFKHSDIEYEEKIEDQVEACKTLCISYDEWINKLQNKVLEDFYIKCKNHNKIK